MTTRLLLLISILLSALRPSAAPHVTASLDGPWHGEITVGINRLPLQFDISADTGKCAMSSPAQGAKGIPADITLSGDTVTITIQSIGARYVGAIRDDRVEGTFTQSGMSFPLSLTRGEYMPPRTQTPKPPFRACPITNVKREALSRYTDNNATSALVAYSYMIGGFKNLPALM